MPSTKFTAIVPQTVQPGDKVRIRGIVSDNAEQFSVNFVNERCLNPQNITYHFKWIMAAQVIVENNKQNGHWMEHIEKDYNSLDGRFMPHQLEYSVVKSNKLGNVVENVVTPSDGNDIVQQEHDNVAWGLNTKFDSSILGPDFALEFAFQYDGIYVYLVYEDGRNNITKYEPAHELSDIEAIQIWGDVNRITELSFSYQ